MIKDSVTLRAFRRYNAYNPKYFPVKFLHILFENLAPYFSLWMSSEIITALYQGEGRTQIYILIAATLAGNLAIRVLSTIFKRAADTQLQILGMRECQAFNCKTLSLDYDKLENPDISRLRCKITENSWTNLYGVKYMRIHTEKLIQGGVNIVLCLSLFTEMVSALARSSFTPLSAAMLAGLAASFVLTVASQIFYASKLSAAYKDVGAQMQDSGRILRGCDVNLMDSRIYRQQSLVTELGEKLCRDHYRAFSYFGNISMVLLLPVSVTEAIAELLSYLIICFYCVLGAFPVGSVIKYVGYLGRMTSSIGSFLTELSNFKVNRPFLATYLEYFDVPNDMYQGSLSVEKRSDKRYDIEFRDVSFRYPGSEDYALKHISLKLKVGERLAVVGMNGSGKTTFIKLLCRLYDPTQGDIFMNDFNIRKYDYRQYLDLFSVVFQDYKLLSVSLGSNVSSSAQWDTDKAESLLEEVGFGERYRGLPKKLETPLYKDFDEDGINVSGGEAQKIALARALYKDAPFIILDEPTAALDPVAEAEIYAKFDKIVGDKTAIYISHRLSSCRFCDKIAVFHQGQIVQVGTHEELLADKEGKYHQLWTAQAQYYTENKA